MDNKHRKLFIIEQPKGCKFMPKCTKIRLTAGLCPVPLAGELMCSVVKVVMCSRGGLSL